MAEEVKKDGAVPPRLDLRKNAGIKPPSVALSAAPVVEPAVHAPAGQPPGESPAVAAPVVAPVAPAPAEVKLVQPVVSQPAAPVQAPQVNRAPSSILRPAFSSAPSKPLGSAGGPITLKAGAPMLKPVQSVSQGQVNVKPPVAAPAAPAVAVTPIVPAAPVVSAAPVVIDPSQAAPLQPAGLAGPAQAVRPGGISPLKPSAAPVNSLRPAGAKPTLKIGASPAAQARTIRLTPGGGGPKAPVSIGLVVPDAKKETSKIPLEAAQPAEGSVVKTPAGSIELKPNEADGKRKTSRISLESVLAADDAASSDSGPSSSGPKTIKLKRPSEAVTIKAVKKGPVTAKPAEPVAGDLSKTAPLDAVADAATASGKHTVKVRRPSMKIKAGGGAAGGTGEDGAAPASAAATAAKGKAAEAAVYEDKAHWVFWLFSLAAVLVVSVMTYMFTSQVIGPDYCLTKASYYTQGYNLDWPYKLSKMP